VTIVGVIILLYLIAGGFDAVVKTDVIQTIWIFLLFVLMMYLLISAKSWPELAFMALFRIPVEEIVSFFLVGLFIPFILSRTLAKGVRYKRRNSS